MAPTIPLILSLGMVSTCCISSHLIILQLTCPGMNVFNCQWENTTVTQRFYNCVMRINVHIVQWMKFGCQGHKLPGIQDHSLYAMLWLSELLLALCNSFSCVKIKVIIILQIPAKQIRLPVQSSDSTLQIWIYITHLLEQFAFRVIFEYDSVFDMIMVWI